MRKRNDIVLGWQACFTAATVIFVGSISNAASITFNYGDLMDSATTTPAAIASGVSGTLSNLGTFSGVADFEAAFKTHVWTQTNGDGDTIELTATAHNGDGTEIWLYGDSSYQGQAGLGAIQKSEAVNGGNIPNVGQVQVANPASADNAMLGSTFNETVKLVANKTVSLDALAFVDADHVGLTLSGSNVQISIDNGAFVPLDNNYFVNNLPIGTTFELQINDGNPSGNTQFYLNSVAFSVIPGNVMAVPLPAAAWMGVSMLGGLGVVGKLRNRFVSN